jgi:pimeloyl-ACP methyl ester carboxylesterase
MQIQANGVTLEVEDHGPASGRPLLMIMGLGMQLVAWPMGLVEALVHSGFRVIRYDNRDIGLSQHLTSLGQPNLLAQGMRFGLGLSLHPAYTLADLADDAAVLIDALGLGAAHVCGASMGGMIAQHLAVRHPGKVSSLTLMMTTSGARKLPGPHWKVSQALLKRPPANAPLTVLVAHYMRLYQLIGSPGYPAEPEALRARVTAALTRSYRPDAVARQMVAILADGDRTPLLGQIKAPTQVIHGARDPLVPAAAGHDLVSKIRGAEIDIIDGMGHDLPEALWTRFAAGVRSAASARRS